VIEVMPFIAEDVLVVRPESWRQLEPYEQLQLGRRYEAAGRAFTVRANDMIVACGGAIELHPRHATLWALYGAGLGRATWARLLKGARHLISTLPHRRIDAYVDATDEAAMEWAAACGLTFEVVLREAHPDGGDMLVYRRII